MKHPKSNDKIVISELSLLYDVYKKEYDNYVHTSNMEHKYVRDMVDSLRTVLEHYGAKI